MISRLISGGQSGVDRAALDVALELGIVCGGWCPRGRRAEDGVIPAHYPLEETKSHGYLQRTTMNVRDSEGTLILTWGPVSGGTKRTEEIAWDLGRGVLVVDLSDATGWERAAQIAREWLTGLHGKTLNTAGPRESKVPGIGEVAKRFLREVLATNPGA